MWPRRPERSPRPAAGPVTMNLLLSALRVAPRPRSTGSRAASAPCRCRTASSSTCSTPVSVAIAALIAMPLGCYIGHTGRGRQFVIAFTGGMRALPTLGVLFFLSMVFGHFLAYGHRPIFGADDRLRHPRHPVDPRRRLRGPGVGRPPDHRRGPGQRHDGVADPDPGRDPARPARSIIGGLRAGGAAGDRHRRPSRRYAGLGRHRPGHHQRHRAQRLRPDPRGCAPGHRPGARRRRPASPLAQRLTEPAPAPPTPRPAANDAAPAVSTPAATSDTRTRREPHHASTLHRRPRPGRRSASPRSCGLRLRRTRPRPRPARRHGGDPGDASGTRSSSARSRSPRARSWPRSTPRHSRPTGFDVDRRGSTSGRASRPSRPCRTARST